MVSGAPGGRATSVALVTYRDAPGLTADDELLADALSARGMTVAAHAWDADVDWTTFAVVILRATWDFHLRLEEFSAWIERLDRTGVRLFNRPALVRWNMTKRYLEALANAGIATVPTMWSCVAAASEAPDLAQLLASQGWSERAIVKPVVSASSHETWEVDGKVTAEMQARFARASAELPHGVMVQPFMPEVQASGEWAMLFFRGAYSHAVLKRPAPSDFRVQSVYGGTATAAVPSPRLMRGAERALEAAVALVGMPREDVLYARVDGVERDGAFVLMELEVIEPALYFDAEQASADRMAAGVAAMVR
jgi:hypothetical protein